MIVIVIDDLVVIIYGNQRNSYSNNNFFFFQYYHILWSLSTLSMLVPHLRSLFARCVGTQGRGEGAGLSKEGGAGAAGVHTHSLPSLAAKIRGTSPSHS